MIRFESNPRGRFTNVLIQNLAMSSFGKKFNLKCQYNFINRNRTNLSLRDSLVNNFKFYGEGRSLSGKPLVIDSDNEENVLFFLDKKPEEVNNPIILKNFFQWECFLNDTNGFFNNFTLKNKIEYKNSVSVHIRLDDVSNKSPGYEYYKKALSQINFDSGVVMSDSPDNEIVKKIQKDFNLKLYSNPCFQDCISFASKHEHRVVTGGSSGWIIGYLGDNDNVYYPHKSVFKDVIWYHYNTFSSNKNWISVTI